jgi:hypothetical protein
VHGSVRITDVISLPQMQPRKLVFWPKWKKKWNQKEKNALRKDLILWKKNRWNRAQKYVVPARA